MENNYAMIDTNKMKGNTVIHRTFGVGTIVFLPENDEDVLVVEFPQGTKRLGLHVARKFITTDNRVLQQMIDKINSEEKQSKERWIVESQRREASRLASIEASEKAARLEELRRAEEKKLERQRRAKEEKERILKELHRQEKIQHHKESIIQKRNITRLCHLTPMEKIPIILADDMGIRATVFISLERLTNNDKNRYDRRTDYICCSVEYPNVRYYWTKQLADKNVKWAVFFISPEIITRRDTLYCKVNAATFSGRYVNEDFDCLFADTIEYQQFDPEEQGYVTKTVPRASELPLNVPTHEQAEVLPHINIPVRWITGIAFNDETTLETTRAILEKNRISYPDLYWFPDLFVSNLHEKLCNGIIPKERLKLQGVKF